MSYESMAREDVACDFPGCQKKFDTRNGVNVALVKDGQVMAFCREHSERLSAEGVALRPLEVVHAELREAKEKPERERMERERVAFERKFINGLKS